MLEKLPPELILKICKLLSPIEILMLILSHKNFKITNADSAWENFVIDPKSLDSGSVKDTFLKAPFRRRMPHCSFFSEEQKRFVSFVSIKQRIEQLNNLINNGDFKELAKKYLFKSNIQNLMLYDVSILSKASELNAKQWRNLDDDGLQPLYLAGILSVDEGIRLDVDEKNNLRYKALHPLILNGILSIEDAKKLNPTERSKLAKKQLHPLIFAHCLTIENVKNLSFPQIDNFCHPKIQDATMKAGPEERPSLIEKYKNLTVEERYNTPLAMS